MAVLQGGLLQGDQTVEAIFDLALKLLGTNKFWCYFMVDVLTL